jgi:hypothetical protein
VKAIKWPSFLKVETGARFTLADPKNLNPEAIWYPVAREKGVEVKKVGGVQD